jgi:hypothetical protein
MSSVIHVDVAASKKGICRFNKKIMSERGLNSVLCNCNAGNVLLEDTSKSKKFFKM